MASTIFTDGLDSFCANSWLAMDDHASSHIHPMAGLNQLDACEYQSRIKEKPNKCQVSTRRLPSNLVAEYVYVCVRVRARYVCVCVCECASVLCAKPKMCKTWCVFAILWWARNSNKLQKTLNVQNTRVCNVFMIKSWKLINKNEQNMMCFDNFTT